MLWKVPNTPRFVSMLREAGLDDREIADFAAWRPIITDESGVTSHAQATQSPPQQNPHSAQASWAPLSLSLRVSRYGVQTLFVGRNGQGNGRHLRRERADTQRMEGCASRVY